MEDNDSQVEQVQGQRRDKEKMEKDNGKWPVKRSGPFTTERATPCKTGGAGAAWNVLSPPEELPIDGGGCGDRATSSTSTKLSSAVEMPSCQRGHVDELRHVQCQKEILASPVSPSWYPSHLVYGSDEHGDHKVSFLILQTLSPHLYAVF